VENVENQAIREVYEELRQMPCTPQFRLNETVQKKVKEYWHNVPGAIAYLREKLQTWERVKSPESLFVAAVKEGRKPEKMIIPANQKQWFDWAIEKRIVLGGELCKGVVYDPDGRVFRIQEMMRLHPME
jgi:hypothetical protein